MKRISLISVLLVLLVASLFAEDMMVSPYQNEVRLVDNNPSQMILEMSLGQFTREAVQINGQTWYDLSLKKEGLTLEAGLPQVPTISRSVIIDGTAKMELDILDTEYVDLPMQVAPSKGNLTRDIDPDTVPYTFDSFYQSNASYPQDLAYLTEPFIIRDYRGITVRFQPFVYLPASQTLRVYTKVQLALTPNGTDLTNALTSPKSSHSIYFEEIYRNMFLNFGSAKYPSLDEEGRILVIKNSMFDGVLQPYVDWKRQNGYRVDVVDVSVAGPTATQIQAYIQNQYNLNDGLMFVQIMGDAPQVPSLSSGGGGSDPSFALLAGGDSYPDIYVGRFSAQNTAELETQIQRTIHYERDLQAGSTWLATGMGIASNEGGGSQGDMGESDQQHMELIRTDLMNYGYTSVDQMYQAMGATAAQVGTNVNQGRGFINYVGHGSSTTWVTTGFSNSNVNALTNDYMLPFIVSVACVNGNFVSQTCFAEAWLRATNNSSGNPTGAVAMYASTINQGWNPPMRGQDEVTDLLIAEAKHTVGGLYYNGSSKMIEVYGTSGISEYKCWTIFGDASLMVRSKDPMAMMPSYTPILFIGMGTYDVMAPAGARVTLYGNGQVYGTAIADASGNASITMANPPIEPMDLTLTITAFNYETHIATINVLPAEGPYVVVDEMIINDGATTSVNYGETFNLDFVFNNVGADTAEDVDITLVAEDQYLVVNTTDEMIGNIPANDSGSTTTGFSITASPNAPDQHQAGLTILIGLSTGETYEYSRTITINAPSFSWGGLQVSEVTGNDNGRIDPGELVTITIPVSNVGHAGASNLDVALVVNGGDHFVEPILTNVTELPVGGEALYIYQIAFSSQIPIGANVQIMAMLYSGEYTAVNTYNVTVGLMLEDFESGGFTGYDWSFLGGNWTLVNQSYDGSTAARSATITHNNTTTMSVTMDIPVAGNISFWKKVSSEANYDYLKFYINYSLKNQWSGTSDDWSQATYAVQPGLTTFKWEYSKDNMVSSGEDCAWIDDIIFPGAGEAMGTPILVVEDSMIDFETVMPDEPVTITLPITNSGDAAMLVSVESSSPFMITENPQQLINLILPAGEIYNLDIELDWFNMSPGNLSTGFLTITTDDPARPSVQIPMMGMAAIVSNDDNLNPMVTELKGNYPNPFNPSTTIAFSLSENSPVRIDVFNITGQRVKTLVNGDLMAGNHQAYWNGLDESGRGVASGVYFYKMRTGKYTSTRKMILMK